MFLVLGFIHAIKRQINMDKYSKLKLLKNIIHNNLVFIIAS